MLFKFTCHYLLYIREMLKWCLIQVFYVFCVKIILSIFSLAAVAPDLLSPAYVDILERNFLENHLYGNRASTVKESMKQLIKQCQVRTMHTTLSN